ncbi:MULTISPECIES: replication endonuclease [unclassified Pseudoalteromonas]|uniref:replication endonuclease n=1 Tax=unclassified Pseudoalteromonas TaxID=194690 RepID=UPI0015FFCADC|nr:MULTISPECIES: replication endonuclease [unclassified Pseudoalteromonas]MBB1333882.1 replication endonuclease [Pseudoalteromonas sp. SR41-6]MBB1459603.1 replication endonuclease [Pseudoalteromonas sp. SG41-8]
MSLWPITHFDVCTAALTMVKAVDDSEHRAFLISGLSRFTAYTQYKMVKQYLAKITPADDAWYKNEPINPSEQAHIWFYDALKSIEHRIDVTDLKLSKSAKSALKKVHDNNHHNYIVKDIIDCKRAPSIQASFVRQCAQGLEFTAKHREVLAQKKDEPQADHTALLQKLVNGQVSKAAMSVITAIDDAEQVAFVYKCLCNVPKPLQMRVAKRFIDRYDTTSLRSQFGANDWLRRTVNTLKPRLKILERIVNNMPLPWHILANADKTKKHASVLSRQVTEILGDLALEQTTWDATDFYDKVSEFAEQFGVQLQFAEKAEYLTIPDAEVALLKAQDHKWWARKLKTIRSRYLEHLEIATGEVGKDLFATHDKKHGTKNKRRGINAYCSKQALAEYTTNRERGQRYLESLELVNEKNDVISLMKAVEAGIANPENMRNELMLRIRETEELADEMGYTGGFYNITAPSRFHANSPTWDGSTPKEASQYLNKLYSQARAKLDRLEIPYFGIRVAEPHADGCTHWHMLLWMPTRYYDKVNHLLRRYFTRDDREVFFERFKNRKKYRAQYTKSRRIWGLNKSKGIYTREPIKNYNPSSPRYTAIKMLPAKVGKDGKKSGGAAAYVAKYVSKNIDGFALANEYDAETGEKLTQAVNPVKAWASTWGIRQFQFQKSPSITIWRELRRVREEVQGNEQLEQVRQAADKGDFKTFVTLMGGFGIGRDARFKPAYQHTEYGNEYAEFTKRLKGVEDTTGLCTLVTRLHTWSKQTIGTAANSDTAVIDGQDANTVSAADLSWTSGNNCTPCSVGHRDELLLDMIGFSKNEIINVKKDLIAGKRIRRNGQIYLIQDGKLLVLDAQAQLKEQRRQSIESIAHTEAQKQHKVAGEQTAIKCNHAFNFLNTQQTQTLNQGGTVVLGDRVYHMQGNDLYSFEKLDLTKAQKTIQVTVSDQHFTYARELYDLAYSYAQIDGRTAPSSTKFKQGHADVIGDLEMARLVLAGEATAISDNDWWSLDLMA